MYNDCMLFVFLCDTLMMGEHDKTYFIGLHLLVCCVTKFDNLSRSIYILKDSLF